MDFNDAVFDGRSDIAGPTTRRPRPPPLPPPPPAGRAETPPKKRRGRPPRKKASGVQAVNGVVAASEESSGTHPGTSGGVSRAGAPPMQMPPPPQPPQPPLVPSTSSTSRKLHDTSAPMPSLSSPVPPPADGVPPVVMVTTLARQAESLARREQQSREVDRAAEEIRRQLLQDKVTGRDVPPASSGKSPRTGSDLQASGGGKDGRSRPSSSAPSPVARPQPSSERIVSSYVPTRQTMADFERLDVLVCGMCKSVFHNIDEFKSHSSTCTKRPGTAASGAEIFENVEDLSSESAVAMVIWCNTIRRVLVQSGVQIDDMGECNDVHLSEE